MPDNTCSVIEPLPPQKNAYAPTAPRYVRLSWQSKYDDTRIDIPKQSDMSPSGRAEFSQRQRITSNQQI